MQIKTVHCLKLILDAVSSFSLNSLSFLALDVFVFRTVIFKCIFDITFITLCVGCFCLRTVKFDNSFILPQETALQTICLSASKQTAWQQKRFDLKLFSSLLLQSRQQRIENITMRPWTIFSSKYRKQFGLPWILGHSDFFRWSSWSIANSMMYRTFS